MYRGNLRRQFQQWSVPRYIRDDLDLADGAECHVIVRLHGYRYAGVVTLTSGEEFRLPGQVAEALSARAHQNPTSAIEFSLSVTPRLENIEGGLLAKIKEAMALSPEEQQRQLANAPAAPHRIEVTTTVFIRNPVVIAVVLARANGVCEKCKTNAPFRRASDETPYLEVHHKVRLADGGVDSVQNAIALCPNCHREAHYG